MRPLSEATSRVTKSNFNRKYIAIGRIVNCWEEIVGAEFADKAQPVKIHYRKATGKRSKPDAVLEVATPSAQATMLHYQKDLILERMNRVFGEQWISDIRFVDVAMAAKAGVRRKRGRYSLNDGQQEELTGMLADIGDDDIKARLARLGEYVLLEESS